MTKEYDITHYIVTHGDGLRKDLLDRVTGCVHSGPFRDAYRNIVACELIRIISPALHLTYEEVAEVVDIHYIEKNFGAEFFSLK